MDIHSDDCVLRLKGIFFKKSQQQTQKEGITTEDSGALFSTWSNMNVITA